MEELIEEEDVKVFDNTENESPSDPDQLKISLGSSSKLDFRVEADNAADKKKTSGVPEHVPYLLIGAGTASFAAYRAIKAKDPLAKILIIGDEEHLPYMRPPLSKELWWNDKATVEQLRFKQWNGRERSLYFEPQSFYLPLEELDNSDKGGISVLLGKRVTKVDTISQTAFLSDGTKIMFDKCLIATG